jgi:DNA/RNA-binding domain of Phe-tRNA-synthetase-like protein
MMNAPLFAVAPEVFERHPDYIVGCVLARGVDNRRAYPALDALLDAAEAAVRADLADLDLKDHPAIAVWRAAFAARGWTPSKYPASVEALARRVAKGNPLPRINPIVDLGNAVVLRRLTPVGAHNVAQLGAMTLTVRESAAGDIFRPMGDSPNETPEDGEIVYAAGHVVRTRRWVWRQASDALVAPSARDVFYPVDGFSGQTDERVRQAVDDLANSCRAVFGATVTTALVSREMPAFEPSH